MFACSESTGGHLSFQSLASAAHDLAESKERGDAGKHSATSFPSDPAAYSLSRRRGQAITGTRLTRDRHV